MCSARQHLLGDVCVAEVSFSEVQKINELETFLGSVLLLVSGTLHLAHAAAIMNVVEVDGNVVATTTGTIDMSGMELLLGPLGASGLFQGDYPGGSALITGSTEMEIGAGYGITWSAPPV